MHELTVSIPAAEVSGGNDVRLVPVVPELDAQTVYRLINEDRAHIEAYDLGFADFSTVKAVQEYLVNRCNEFAFGVMAANQMAGNVYLSHTQVPELMAVSYWIAKSYSKRGIGTEVSYWIAKSYSKRGIGTEAIQQAVDFAFAELNTHAVLASVNSGNVASVALLKRLGFGRIERQMVEFPSGSVEICHYALLNPGSK